MSKRTATIGAAIGLGSAALCIVLALAMHAIHPYLPEIRAFLLWAMAPQFAMGMFLGAALCATGIVITLWGDRHV